MTIASLEAACQTRPGDTSGTPTGYGDWRIAVEVLLPTYAGSLWGVAKWGEDEWSFYEWVDITAYARGLTWTRGASEFDGRPEVGVATVTLDNTDYAFSPIDPTNSFRDIVNVDDADELVNFYFGPGTLLRIVAHSPTDATVDGWVPQITGVVESWPEVRNHLDVESFIDVTFKETLSRLARVDELGVPAAGLDEEAMVRVPRLCDAAEWPFGYIFHNTVATDFYNYNLQATTMAGNRLAELYLTADSTGAVLRSDRSGALVMYDDRNGAFGGGGPETLLPARGPSPEPKLYAADLVATDPEAVYIDPEGLTWDNDDEPIINVVSLSRVGGTEQNAENALSRGRYGRITYSRNDLIMTDDVVAQFLADELVARRSDLTLRLRSARFDSLADSNAVGALVSLDVGSNVKDSYFKTASNTSYVNIQTLHVDSMVHNVTPTSLGGPAYWTCTYTFGYQTTPQLVAV